MLLISEDDRATVRSLAQLESEACDVIIVTCGASTFEVRGSNLRLFSLVGRVILRVAKFGSREKAPSPGSVYRDPPNKIAFGISGREGGLGRCCMGSSLSSEESSIVRGLCVSFRSAGTR